ncbi:MAG: MgtC/SapB family protein [Betaproteobacteria bacterium]|nr:MAG: MgtC/SapB family protein [Betaproteobacteria bacterium]
MNFGFLETTGLAPLPAFVTSLALGLLIGLERERNPASRAGLRTFALVALLGTLTALIAGKTGSPWILAAGLILVGLMMIAANARTSDAAADPGTTSVAAVCVCYSLGALIWLGYPTLAVMLGVLTTMLLYFKPELRGLSQSLTRQDLLSILQFAALSFVILPVLPNQSFGPYNALNPYQIWLMVVLISGISLAGYVALRLTGGRHGVLLLGLMGGLVSSTATSMVYARHARDPGMLQLAAVVILTANLVVPARLAVLAGVVAPAIVPLLLPALAGAFACGAAGTLYWWRKLGQQSVRELPEIRNPTEIRAALGFGLLFGVVLFCSAWLSDVAGSRGLYAVALVSGLTDVDAITLSTLRLYDLGALQPFQAVSTIVLALVSNIAFKLGLVFVVGGGVLARRCAAPMLAAAAGAGLVLVFLPA